MAGLGCPSVFYTYDHGSEPPSRDRVAPAGTRSRNRPHARGAGRGVEDAMVGYLKELGDVREMLDNRYEEMKRGRIKAVDGETAFAELRRRGEKRRAHSLIHDVRAGMSEF